MVMPPDMQAQLINQPRMAQLPPERKMDIHKVIAMSRAKLAQQAQAGRPNAIQPPAPAAAQPPTQAQNQNQNQNQNQAKQPEPAPARPPTAQGIQQKAPAAPQAVAPTAAGPQGAPAAQMDPTKQLLKNKEQVHLIRQEETQKALARPIIQMSEEVKAVTRQAVKEVSLTLVRMEQWIPMFLMLLPSERIVRELFQTRAVVATQFEDTHFQTPKENFTITPDELDAAKSQILRYFNYVKAQVPKLNEQRIKQGQPPIPMGAVQQQQLQQQKQFQQAQNLHVQPPAAKAPVPNLTQTDLSAQPLQQQQQQQQQQQKLPVQNLQQPTNIPHSAAAHKVAAPPAPTAPLPPAAPFNLGQIPPRKKAKQGSESPSFPKSAQPDPKAQSHAMTQAAGQKGVPGKGTLPAQYTHLCIVKACEYHTKGFQNQQDLLRHLKEDHKDAVAGHMKQPQSEPPKVLTPQDLQALREKQERMIEERNRTITNPLEYTLGSVAEALGLARDGTRKAKEDKQEEVKDKEAAAVATKAPTPRTSTPLTKTPSKAAPTPSGIQSSPPRPVEVKEERPTSQLTPPFSGWDDSMISPTVIQQAFEGLNEITDLVIDQIDISMILTPDDGDDLDESGEKLPGTPPFGTAGIPEARNGGDALAMSEEEMKDFESWNPFGIRNSGPRGLVEDIDWELVDAPGTTSGSSTLSGWDNSFFEIRS
ncbi:hypothetical protein TWF706_008773 [Orbilia oligospora]|nr:hypothetical protein TWF706_008773 [Orbilia oligospora]